MCPIPPLRAVDHERLTGREVELIVEAPERRHPVGAEHARLLDGEPLRDGRDGVLVQHDVFRVEPARERVGVHAIAHVVAPHAVSDRGDLARAVVPDDLREAGRPELQLARSDVGVPDADPGGVEPDEHLPRPRARHRERLGVQDLGPSVPVECGCLHLPRNLSLHGVSPVSSLGSPIGR